jgi:hypothetical protein
MKPGDQIVVNSVIRWFEQVVLGLNLCPFAQYPYRSGRVRFELTHARDDESCLTDLYLNLNLLEQQPEIETLLLICKHHLSLFEDFNQFLQLADLLLEREGWQGVYQIASFHPDYRFEGTAVDDIGNWTNRSPYPILHLIREHSIEKAIASHRNIEDIPQHNISALQQLNETQRQQLFGMRYQAKKNRDQ